MPLQHYSISVSSVLFYHEFYHQQKASTYSTVHGPVFINEIHSHIVMTLFPLAQFPLVNMNQVGIKEVG